MKRAITLAGALAVAGILTLASPALATGTTDQLVTSSELPTTSNYAAPGQTSWTSDNSGGGTDTFTTDAYDGRSALKFTVPGTSGQVTVYHSYGAGVQVTDIPALLVGSSFTYTGLDMNFQLAMTYVPVDLADFGPTSPVTPCKPAGPPDTCFTVIKFEPALATASTWVTTTLGDKQQPRITAGGAVQPGWWNTRRVGQYAQNAATATLGQLLGQMASYQVYGVGASIGTSAPAGDSWLLNLTVGGVSYSFGTASAPATPPAPPAADTAALDTLISTDHIDVAAQTAQFVPTGSTNTDLSKVDAGQPVNGQYQDWQGPSDAFADVWSYSSAAWLGTFPIVNGNVVLTGANLLGLTPGVHHLLFRGQTSGTLGVVQITVLATLAATGSPPVGPSVIVAVSLVGAGILLRRAGRRSVRRHDRSGAAPQPRR